MPAFLTHKIIGEKVLEKIKGHSELNERAFHIGCQGPDILYYNMKSIRSGILLGLEMHNVNTGGLFRHALDYIRNCDESDRVDLISYIAGYLTHIVVDIKLHKLILDIAGNKIRKHHALEHLWDSFLLKNMRGMELGDYTDTADILGPGTSISSWYISAAENVYGKKLKAESLQKAQHNFMKKHTFALGGLKGNGSLFLKLGYKIKQRLVKSVETDETLNTREQFLRVLQSGTDSIGKSCEMIMTMFDFIFEKKKQPVENEKSIGCLDSFGPDLSGFDSHDLLHFFNRLSDCMDSEPVCA